MNSANQLIKNIQSRFKRGSSCDSLEDLTEEQLKCRKRKIKSTYSILGISFLIALLANLFALLSDSKLMNDQLLFFIPFATFVVALLIVLFKEGRKKIDQINEILEE